MSFPVSQLLIPSSFLPPLPRTQNALSPWSSVALLAHIALLRELYIPPIRGVFQIADVSDTEHEDAKAEVTRRSRARARRFSAGLVETMDGMGLGLELDGITATGQELIREKLQDTIFEEDSDVFQDEEEGIEDDGWEEENEDEMSTAHLDPFEREWAEKWLNGVVKRAQSWLEEHEGCEESALGSDGFSYKEMEVILRDTIAVLAMMAGTSAAGSLTRHLIFPVHHSLAPGVQALRQNLISHSSLSPETTTFLASLATSPVSPIIPFLRRANVSLSPQAMRHLVPSMSPDAPRRRRRSTLRNGELSPSPEAASTTSHPISPTRGRHRGRAAIPVLLHDASMSDHLSVGVQTWGSAILLGREMALRPAEFGLFSGPSTPSSRGVRVLELGAGTGLLSILCRKLLDLRQVSNEIPDPKYPGVIIATDFLPEVLSNLKVCVDLNFPPHVTPEVLTTEDPSTARRVDQNESGIQIAKLDWTTFPAYMASSRAPNRDGATPKVDRPNEVEIDPLVEESFDLVLASDCVYDPTHAKMLREVAAWVLRLPGPSVEGDIGGTFHILSPIRPTFTPELESIDRYFPPLTTYPPLDVRRTATQSSDVPAGLSGEGLGSKDGLRLGTRGEGKKSLKGRRGEGRVDEVAGYWWWEVGWG